MRGVSLEEITAATRIATRFLQAIENEQWDQLPGGVFNRGFVRAVAHYLGLDEESLVAEYVSTVGDRPSVPVWTGTPPAVTADLPWLAWILAAVVVLALIAGGWFAVRRISAWRASRRATRMTAISAAPSQEQPAAPPAAGSVPVSAEPAPNPASVPPQLPGGANLPAATPFKLKVEAVKTTRMTVEADTHRVFEGDLEAGEGRTFTAQDKFQVAAGDAGALLLELNGKTLSPMGPPGQEGKVTLTREALQGAGGGGH